MSESASINVNGMKCGGCENTLNTALAAIDGVLAVKASHQEKRVDVEFDPAKTDLDEIEDAISDAGFSVE
jgi:copper chaperone CopZ